MKRRRFLLGMAAGVSAGSRLYGAPSDRVRVGCAGIGGRGRDHLNGFGALPNVEIAALCDVDEGHLEEGTSLVERREWGKPQPYGDFRKMLEDQSIDAIAISSPNHWHALMTIWACQAGKDVYVEKPCSHNVFESRQIVAAARKYGRVVQHGTQNRSSPAAQEAVRRLREGLIGEVYLARGLCYKWRDTIGRTPPEAVPVGVDYDLWTGPAPMKPFTRNRFHYNWHWIWDTGNGDLGNQGVHQMDIACWGLGVTYPVKVSAIGGHFMFDDDQETPNTLNCAYEFVKDGKSVMMEFEVRHWMSNGEAELKDASGPNTIGNVFYGSNGYMAVNSSGSYRSWLGRDQEPGPSATGTGDHFANFIDSVRSRDSGSLTAEVEEGAVTSTLIHLANISYRVGRTIRYDAASMSCIGDSEASALLSRDYRAPYVIGEEV